MITDQVQHRTALQLGVPDERVQRFGTYREAADAVLDGSVDAYASVARAHRGYLDQQPGMPLAVVDVPRAEKAPELGAFTFAKAGSDLRAAVEEELGRYLGSSDHRALMAEFGFTAAEVDLIAPGP